MCREKGEAGGLEVLIQNDVHMYIVMFKVFKSWTSAAMYGYYCTGQDSTKLIPLIETEYKIN